MRPGSLVNPTWREPTQLEVRPSHRHDLWLAIDVRRSPGVGDSFTVRGLHYTTGQLRTMAGNRSWWNDHVVEEP